MNKARIAIAATGEGQGFVIAVLPPPEGFHSGQRLAVGEFRCLKGDGKADLWQAWLWPVPGGQLHVWQSCESVTGPDFERFAEKIRRRARMGAWWEKGIL